MAPWMFTVLVLSLAQFASATPNPFILSVARGTVRAAQTKVDAAQGISNAAIRAGSSGVNAALDAAEGLEAVKSNAIRAALNTGRTFGTEVLNQTRSVANILPGNILKGGANLGISVVQHKLDMGVNAATMVANTAQGLVNRTAAFGRRVNAGLSSAAQGGVNLTSRVAGTVLSAKDNILGGVQGLLPSRNNSTVRRFG